MTTKVNLTYEDRTGFTIADLEAWAAEQMAADNLSRRVELTEQARVIRDTLQGRLEDEYYKDIIEGTPLYWKIRRVWLMADTRFYRRLKKAKQAGLLLEDAKRGGLCAVYEWGNLLD
jgi:hypothetical protein